jgi:hypothetical protein
MTRISQFLGRGSFPEAVWDTRFHGKGKEELPFSVELCSDHVLLSRAGQTQYFPSGVAFRDFCLVNRLTVLFLEAVYRSPAFFFIRSGQHYVLDCGRGVVFRECACPNHDRLKGGRDALDRRFVERMKKEELASFKMLEIGSGYCLSSLMLMYQCYRFGFKEVEFLGVELDPSVAVFTQLNDLMGQISEKDPSFKCSVNSCRAEFIERNPLESFHVMIGYDFEYFCFPSGATTIRTLRDKAPSVPLLLSAKGATFRVGPDPCIFKTPDYLKDLFHYFDMQFESITKSAITFFLDRTEKDIDILILMAFKMKHFSSRIMICADPIKGDLMRQVCETYFPTATFCTKLESDESPEIGNTIVFSNQVRKGLKLRTKEPFSQSAVYISCAQDGTPSIQSYILDESHGP